jgi:hypothetical protein
MGTNDHERLSYRALADRLAISPDAARMKAKRQGWCIVPGNHPNAPVMVEVPLNALAERVPREQQDHKALRTSQSERPNNDERLLTALSEAVALLGPAQEQIERLHAQLVEAKDAHHRDAVELAAAEMREMGTKAELERALADCKTLRREHAEAIGSLTVLKRHLAYHRSRSLWQKIIGK